MALQLLGSKYCIESLRNDVTDLQEAVIDVFSRAGPVRLPSWKYPDKVSSDLDMTDLLEIYDYSDDEEDRQIAHIVLLELVIDRMVLLVQSLTKYMDQSLSTGARSAASPNISGANNSSIGLVVKKYWNKMVHLQSVLQNLNSENKNNKRKIVDLENNMRKLSQEKGQLLDTAQTLQETLETTKTPFPLSEADLEKKLSRAASTISISRDECNKSTQTVETAFVPCESCDCVQKHFRQVGDNVITMCQSQGLPSCLAKFKPQVAALDWLTANDVIRWATEENKDVNRLNKHLSDYDALKADLESERQKNKKLQQKISEFDKEMKLERETQNTQRRHFENKIKDIKKVNEEAINTITKQKDEVDSNKKLLETQLGQMKGELGKQKDLLLDLEKAKKKVEHDLHENKTNNSQIKSLENDIDQIERKLKGVTEQLDSTQTELSKEKAKTKSVTKHTESIKGKQESLLSRIDGLDQDNEELRGQVEDLEDSKDQLERALETAQIQKEELEQNLMEEKAFVTEITMEKQKLEESITDLNGEIGKLEQTLQEAKEHERLIVEYPDLNGPVNPDLQGTGDIAKDMENQVKANSIRIQLLEDQNTRLRNSITKILKAQQGQPKTPQMTGPMPLWKSSAGDSPDDQREPYHSSNSKPPRVASDKGQGMRALTKTAESTKVRDSFVIGKGTKSPDKRTRPPSAKGNNSSIGAYVGLKKAGLLNKDIGRPSSGQSSGGSYQPNLDVIMCPQCDKIYNSKKDLEIHKSYCQG